MFNIYMKLLIIFVSFLIGLYFCATQKHRDVVENFSSDGFDCPNLLIQEGNSILLMNRNKAIVPGVNPIRFGSLEEYVQFLKWQRHAGIRCPVLYFKQSYDAQGNLGYRMLPDPLEPNAGLPSYLAARQSPLYGKSGGEKLSPLAASISGGQGVPHRLLHDATRDDKPYNQNMYAGFDGDNQSIGTYTPLDKLFHSSATQSANPIDTNWAGREYTRRLIDAGVYSGDARRADDSPFITRSVQKEWRREDREFAKEAKEHRARQAAGLQRRGAVEKDGAPTHAGDRYYTASRSEAAKKRKTSTKK
jgi:hypothetical protein